MREVTVSDCPIPTLPITCKGEVGEVVPIPTFPYTDSPNPGMEEDKLTPVQPIPALPAMYKEAVGELVPIPMFPSTIRPLLAEAGRVEKAYDDPIPTDPNTPKVVPGAELPIPNLIKELFQ